MVMMIAGLMLTLGFAPPYSCLIILLLFLNLSFKLSEFEYVSASLSWSSFSLSLTALAIYLMVVMSYLYKSSKVVSFSMVMLMALLVLMFGENNLLYFYIYFEFSLIPMVFMIWGWGLQPERLISGVYMLFYTVSSSLPFLMVALYLHPLMLNQLTDKFTISSFYISGLVLVCPFLVKSPMFLVHLWLPKAHVEAPVYGSMVLAGILLKIGGYGLMRLSPLVHASVMLMVCCFSVIGGALASASTLAQVDVKALIAYSSVVHMSTVTVVVLISLGASAESGLLMMLGHGVCSSGLFYSGTAQYERLSSRSMLISQGMMKLMPSFTLLWVVLILMNFSCPPSVTLFSEVLMMYYCASFSFLYLCPIGLMVVSVLVYSLHLFCAYTHSGLNWIWPTPSESIIELAVVSSHAWWWGFSPMFVYLLE